MEGTSSKQQSLQQHKCNSPSKEISPATLRSGVTPPSDGKEETGHPYASPSTSPDTERCQKVFKEYYARLCDVLPVEEVLPHLVSNNVITILEMDDVLTEKTTFRQARALLNGPIWGAISGGYPQAFITLLCVLRPIRSCETLCEEICTNLNISTEVMTRESREFKYIVLLGQTAFCAGSLSLSI